uniref:Uncharacterized protein n=1 Tax=Anguilla anguilla TaxID=7936 RepID=A0A0E9SUX5_ANGAN
MLIESSSYFKEHCLPEKAKDTKTSYLLCSLLMTFEETLCTIVFSEITHV